MRCQAQRRSDILAHVKTCTLCKKDFPATLVYFYSCKTVKSGLRSRCKTCIALGNKETRDPDKARLRLQAWRKSNPEKVQEYVKKENQKKSDTGYHKEYYNKNKEKINQRRNKWGHRTGKFSEYNHKRRDRISGEVVPEEEWKKVLEYYGAHCLVPDCSYDDVTRDHVVPLSRGGRNHISNLQPLCRHHNCKKHIQAVDYRPDRGARFNTDEVCPNG